MNSEDQHLTGLSFNYEQMLKAKKIAKIVIFMAILGVFAGLSAALVFYTHYYLIITPIFAALSAFLALLSIYIHVQFLRNIWQIWTNQLKHWSVFGLLTQTASVFLFIFFMLEAIIDHQELNVNSSYVTCVWCFMCWKWSFMIYYRASIYQKMFTKYQLIERESEVE